MVESVKNHQTNKSKFMVISWVIFFYGPSCTHTHTLGKIIQLGCFYILHSNCSSRIRSASHQTRQFPVVNPLAEPHLVRGNPLRAIAFFSIAASMIAREQRIKLESNQSRACPIQPTHALSSTPSWSIAIAHTELWDPNTTKASFSIFGLKFEAF